MKIAIPTNDNIVVSNHPRQSGFFSIITFRGDKLADIECRENPLKGGSSDLPLTASEKNILVSSLADCDIIIGGTRPNELSRSTLTYLIETVITDESLVIKAATSYNKRQLQNKRDTCCSP